MKINEVIAEGFSGVARELAKHYGGEKNYNATQNWLNQRSSDKVQAQAATVAPEQPADNKPDPESDISKLVPAGKQLKFQNPDLPGSFIIIRQDGYWQDRISRDLVGQVKKVNGLYPVLRPENIKKFNNYYNVAADTGRVREEPVHAL